MKTKTLVKSPLRYPGGKQKALDQLVKVLPKKFTEYREPFLGGGSLYLYIRQTYPDIFCWVNDLNEGCFSFWRQVQNPITLNQLINYVRLSKSTYLEGRELYLKCNHILNNPRLFDKGANFFILNRITFSGTIESGGYSEQAFQKRFTQSSIDRLKQLDGLLTNTHITNLDYSELLSDDPNVFIYFDPPYLANKKSKLYGKKGNLHTGFDHVEFAAKLKDCKCKWLVTLDDCEEVRELFSFAKCMDVNLQYGMNNYGQTFCKPGKELFITNYEVE